MLTEHTLTQLRSLRLDGMVRAVEEQATSTAATSLGFDERLTLLVQSEIAWRDNRRVQRLLKAARLKVSSACVEDINWHASRSLDRSLVATLAGGDWLRNAQNLLITGMKLKLPRFRGHFSSPREGVRDAQFQAAVSGAVS